VGIGGLPYAGVLDTNLWAYDTLTNAWTKMAPFPGGTRDGAFAFTLGSKAYVGCGLEDEYPFTHDVWQYDASANTWTRMHDFPDTSISGPFSFTIGNTGYVGGGNTPISHMAGIGSDSATSNFWRYNSGSDTWTQLASIPAPYGIVYSADFVLGRKGYVGTGYGEPPAIGLTGGLYATTTFYVYDTLTGAWDTLLATFPGHRREYAIGFSIGDIGYIGTGYNFMGQVLNDFWEYAPRIPIPPHCCITCANMDTAVAAFNRLYALRSTLGNYETIYTNYLNQYFGFDLSYTDYQQFTSECSSGQTLTLGDGKMVAVTLCNKAVNEVPVVVSDSNPCASQLLEDATYSAKNAYTQYIDSIATGFTGGYIKHCMQIDDSFHVNAPFDEYHYTLYYYDQAGNLVKTVPPQGVHPITSAASLDSVADYREGSEPKAVYPKDSLESVYWFNTLNSPIQQATHDGNITHYWYDRLGRLTLSQNAVQTPFLYSYTLYDALNRIIEVGQVNTVPQNTPNCFHTYGPLKYGVLPVVPDTFARKEAELVHFIEKGTRTQITHTYYDSVTYSYLPFAQQNLRKRIASITYKDVNINADSAIKDYDNAIHYTYDIEGNVKSILIDVPHDSIVKQRYKRLDYYYDLISGKVNEIVYQHDSIDQFMQSYEYDADNRITDVLTSHDSLFWENDASYQYYSHGPLARAVIGRRQVQGMDYAYTLNGWIKGMNSSIANTTTSPSFDMGQDGYVHGANATVGRDAMGYTLNYFGGDYRPIGGTTFEASGLPTVGLYNGNISGATYSIAKLNPKTIGYTYNYDQLNRLTQMKAFAGIDTVMKQWAAADSISSFRERATYDDNGNILTYVRHGNTIAGMPLAMDSERYCYNKGTNQLNHIADGVASGNYPNDLDNEPKNNYRFNGIGERAKDSINGIDTITWTIYGKVHKIVRYNGDSIVYAYDPLGNKLEERYYHSTASDTQKYVRDAQGNILAIYDRKKDTVRLKEWDIYGSKRIGEVDTVLRMQKVIVGYGPMDSLSIAYLEGQKQYELDNHLGNVLVTVSDRKLVADTNGDGVADYYVPNVMTAQDYGAFGGLQPGRTFNIANYEFGFNGKLRDDSIFGKGNFSDYGMRVIDWTYQFWSIDPLTKKYPELTPYQFASNTPIQAIDLDGEERMTPAQAKLAVDALKNMSPQQKAILADVTGVAAGAVTVAAGIVAAPVTAVVLVISGSYAIAASTTKVVADAVGKHDDAEKVPSTYLGATLGKTVDALTGNKNNLAENSLNVVEDAVTLKASPPAFDVPTAVSTPGIIGDVSGLLNSVQKTMDNKSQTTSNQSAIPAKTPTNNSNAKNQGATKPADQPAVATPAPSVGLAPEIQGVGGANNGGNSNL